MGTKTVKANITSTGGRTTYTPDAERILGQAYGSGSVARYEGDDNWTVQVPESAPAGVTKTASGEVAI